MVFKVRKKHLRRSRQQEKRIARETGGRTIAGSGSTPSDKGDVKDGEWLTEAKTTTKVAFRLTLSDWRKIEKQAMRVGKEPAMQLDISGRHLVVIDYNTWLRLKADY